MLSWQLANQIDGFLATVNNESYLLQILHSLAAENVRVHAAAIQTINSDDLGTVHNLNRQSRAAVDKALAVCRGIEPFELSKELEQFQNAHAVLAASLSLGKDRESHYSNLVSNFKTAFTAFYKQASYVSIPQLLQAAALLHSNITGDREMLRLISADLKGKAGGTELDGFAKLTIYFASRQTLDEIAGKLAAISEIYSELCELLAISPSQFPLSPRKIETGSFWSDLLGYPKVILLIEKYIDLCIGYLHRTYTREGKLGQLPRTVDQMDALIGLRSSLAEQGIKVEEIDANIEKAAVKLSRQFNVLLGGEPSVEVNGKAYSVAADLKNRMLEERSVKLLGHEPTERGTEVSEQRN